MKKLTQVKAGLLTAIAVTLGSAVQAQAGSLFITGHDTDDHFDNTLGVAGAIDQGGDEYQTAGLDYITFGAAATGSQITDRANVTVGYLGDFQGGFGPVGGYTNTTFIDLSNPNWEATAFAPGAFDILMVGTGGDYVDDSGSTELNAAESQFDSYFNAGGGIFVNSEQGLGQSFYNFLPTFGTAAANSISDSGAFNPTSAGLAIGLTDEIVDADITHTYFTGVDTTTFTVFENTDPALFNGLVAPVAIGVRGVTTGGGVILPPPPPPTQVPFEPSPTLGLMGLGAWATVSQLKRKLLKKA